MKPRHSELGSPRLASVVFLRGCNVGGRRTFRPSVLAKELHRLGLVNVVNVGAAGTFVVPGPVRRSDLRASIASRLPFETEIVICGERDVLDLASADPFAGLPSSREVVRFVSIGSERPASVLPETIPADGRWGLRVLGRRGPFIFGIHRREMKAIGYLSRLEKAAGTSLATRSWSTIVSIANLLQNRAMPKAKPTTVDEYVAAAPEEGRKHVREMRAILKKAAPKAKETLKWNQPAYEAERILFAFAAFKSHLNFNPTPSVIRQFEKELAPYKTGKGSIQFPYDEPLPKTLIRKLAARRVKELKEKDAKWM